MFEDFGIEMLTVPLIEDGIDLDEFKRLLKENENVVGILSVPRHSNPSGEVFSDENISNLFDIGMDYSDNFLFLFDNAYLVHDFLPTRIQKPVWEIADKAKAINQTVVVTSFSKVTFGGGGISFMASSGKSLELVKKIRASMVICPDKINQKRHTQFFSDSDDIIRHMAKHAELIRPKFEIAYAILETLSDECGSFSRPTGGYFITFTSTKPIATRVVELCEEVGVLITPAGATFPYGNDPKDNIIRIAPTFVDERQLEVAMDVFITAVQIAHSE